MSEKKELSEKNLKGVSGGDGDNIQCQLWADCPDSPEPRKKVIFEGTREECEEQRAQIMERQVCPISHKYQCECALWIAP